MLYQAADEDEQEQAQDEDELTGVNINTLAPVWSFDRFGQSMNILPDGRVFIAGEHEDDYDWDFRIYNDVVVAAPNGDIEHIFGYPPEIFPPTDFHAAVFVPPENGIGMLHSFPFLTSLS